MLTGTQKVRVFGRGGGARPPRVAVRSGTSLMETVVGMAVIGILFVALYAGVASGIRMLQLSRENLRATQILVEKMEGVRLFNWDQVNSNGFIPTHFAQAYYSNRTAGAGVMYHGRVTVTNVPFTASYAPEMMMVEVELLWTSSTDLPRRRSIRTFVSRYGLQNYVY